MTADPRSPVRPRRRARRVLVVALLAGPALAAGAGAWGLASYVRLLRLEVRVADACARAESTGREQLDLATNLLHAAAGAPELASRRAALRGAVNRARASVLTSPVLATPGGVEEFFLAHEAVGASLRAVRADLDAGSTDGAALALRDLGPGLERAEKALGLALAEVQEHLDAYREACGSFPERMVVRFVGVPPPAPPARAGAATGDLPVQAAAGPGVEP